jgi:hypothetical protein
VDAEQLDNLSKALSACEVAIATNDLQAFPKAFDGLAYLLRSQLDLMALAALVKRCRERRQIAPTFRNILYLYGVDLVYVRLLQKRAPAYSKGFKQDEHEFFITRDESGDPFCDDFVLELEYVMQKNLGEDRPGAICKGLAALQIQASKMRMELTPIREAAAVAGFVDALWTTKGGFHQRSAYSGVQQEATRQDTACRRDGRKRVYRLVGQQAEHSLLGGRRTREDAVLHGFVLQARPVVR